jgi:hypothetical protein
MEEAQIPPPGIATRCSGGRLGVHVSVASPLQDGRLALSAVIEEAGGAKSYWALAHPPGRPDFHSAAGFLVPLQPAA